MEQNQCPMCDGSFDWALTWVAAITGVIGVVAYAAERLIGKGVGGPVAIVLAIVVLVGAPFVFRHMENRKELAKTE